MVTGIIGQKIGMTQVFTTDGVSLPVTVLKAGPCVVVQQKTIERDGYESVQIGLVEDKPPRVNKGRGRALQAGQRAADPGASRGEGGGDQR